MRGPSHYSRGRTGREMNRRILTSLNRALRRKAAIALAVLYALCVLMPAAAVALTSAAHCLTGPQGAAHVHQAASQAHVHSDGVAHAHADQPADHADGAPHEHSDAAGAQNGNCCGLFCVSAIAHDAHPALGATIAAQRTVPARAYALPGRGPERINRPPIG